MGLLPERPWAGVSPVCAIGVVPCLGGSGPPTVANQLHVAVVRSMTGMFMLLPRSLSVWGMSICAVTSCPEQPPVAREMGVTNTGLAPAACAWVTMLLMLL